ncbi:trans-sulfuration enzyme family protein [Aliidiomarina celeris]|uniref:trans-sulfuration enzyme family protein n=1 Tax=Aliidiomarina celeris TaxID=2249428 RepID=UPI000DE98D28|nr:PLP-dependent aspartate aminotransferase family protein [Aliidiomarina celeris]
MTLKHNGYEIETKIAQALNADNKAAEDHAVGGVVPAIHMSTTYYRDADNEYRSGRVYGRDDNPTFLPAEQLLANLEQGEESLLFSSGMAAAVAVFYALTPGSTVFAPKVMYWALRNWLAGTATEWGLKVQFLDMTDTGQVVQALHEQKPALIWLESPANPLWQVTDIATIAAAAKGVGSLVAVDSTVATPIFCQPLSLGADIVMHSATKYLNGHSDVVAGALVTRHKTDFWLRVRQQRRQAGAILSPFDASQLLRGMRTLALRVRYSAASALWLAEQLQQHPRVAAVLYPGLPSCAGHEIAKAQWQGGFGGMLSVRFKDSSDSAADFAADFAIKVAAHTKLWKRATSLGAVESLIEHRASIEGPGTPVPHDLLRLSVGIEAPQDLLNDLEQAMQRAGD